MAQKVVGYIKIPDSRRQSDSGSPCRPGSRSARRQHYGQFTKEFNERTKNDIGLMIPVVITVYADRSFTFITKTPPAAVLIKKACGIETASGVPQQDKVANHHQGTGPARSPKQKMPDLNCCRHRVRHQHDRRYLRAPWASSSATELPDVGGKTFR